MSVTGAPAALPQTERSELLQNAADDLSLLARLHDREPDIDLLEKLRDVSCWNWFSLRLDGAEANADMDLMDSWLADLPDKIGTEIINELAADYAELYLTYSRRISASESVWLTEEHLERQEPMFAVRKWYRHYGLEVPDWRTRADDHLVHQLQFVAHLLQHPEPSALIDAGHFLDDHLMLWIGDFAAGMAQCADTPFYASLGLLTRAELEHLRGMIEALTGQPRKRGELTDDALQPSAGSELQTDDHEAPFIPGSSPGW